MDSFEYGSTLGMLPDLIPFFIMRLWVFPPHLKKSPFFSFSIKECRYSPPSPDLIIKHVLFTYLFGFLLVISSRSHDHLVFYQQSQSSDKSCSSILLRTNTDFKCSQEELKQHIFHNCNLLLPITYTANTSRFQIFRRQSGLKQ